MLVQDVRYALRTLARNPGFTALGILVLGLGIASTTAVFSVVNAALLRPLPYADPSRLVAVSLLWPGATRDAGITLRSLETWREQTRSLSDLGSFVFTELPVRAGSESDSLVTAAIDPELLRTLGVRPMLGANFSGSGSTAPDRSAIVSYRFWHDDLGGDPSAVGRAITIDGSPFMLAGVLPASFQFPRADASFFDKDVDLLIPVVNIADQWGRDNAQWFAVGRLAPGATAAQAQSELAAIDTHARHAAAGAPVPSVRVSALSERTSRQVRPALLIIFGISVVLLAIACVNVMSLWFSRAAARTREIAIRKAIGASLGRIVRQMMTESACLTCSAGLVGILLARVFQHALITLSPFHLPISGRIDIDWRVVAFAVLVCAAATLSGVLPALHSSLDREHLMSGAGARSSSGRLVRNVQRVLTASQVALGLALLVAAGLLVNSLWRLSDVDPGFRSRSVVGFTFSVPSDHPRKELPALYDRVLAGLGSLPGVESVGLVNYLPPEQRKGVFVPVTIDGAPVAPNGPRPLCNFAMSNPGYFATLGIPIVAGRAFTDADSASSTPVAIANDAFAKRYLSDGRVLGRRIKTPFDGQPREIVGVIGPMRDRGLGAAPVPAIYVPFKQFAFGYGSIAVRAAIPASSLVPAIRARVAAVDGSIPLQNFETLDARIRGSLGEPRFYTVLSSACAGLAVLFVALGLYGVMAYSVSRRTAEIGVRIAVGAQPSAIVRMVLQQGLIVGLTGAAAGAALALWLTGLLRGLLYGITPADPMTFAAAIAFVLGVTLAASYLPARRASRVDPIVALRQE